MAKLRKVAKKKHKTIIETKIFESHSRWNCWQIIRDNKADLRQMIKIKLNKGQELKGIEEKIIAMEYRKKKQIWHNWCMLDINGTPTLD